MSAMPQGVPLNLCNKPRESGVYCYGVILLLLYWKIASLRGYEESTHSITNWRSPLVAA